MSKSEVQHPHFDHIFNDIRTHSLDEYGLDAEEVKQLTTLIALSVLADEHTFESTVHFEPKQGEIIEATTVAELDKILAERHAFYMAVIQREKEIIKIEKQKAAVLRRAEKKAAQMAKREAEKKASPPSGKPKKKTT